MNYTPDWEPVEVCAQTSMQVIEENDGGRAGFRQTEQQAEQVKIFEEPLQLRRGFSLFGWTIWVSRD